MHAIFTTAAVAAGVLFTTAAVPAEAATSVHYVSYANCTAMHRVYPHGVGLRRARDKVRGSTKPVTTFYRNDRLYRLNTRLDRDHDGIACERR